MSAPGRAEATVSRAALRSWRCQWPEPHVSAPVRWQAYSFTVAWVENLTLVVVQGGIRESASSISGDRVLK